MHYFVRVNGNSGHNDPGKPESYVPGEPPIFPARRFNYVDYCLRENIVRIGWPDTGDLGASPKTGALVRAYDLGSLRPHVKGYLAEFREIAPGSVVLMPNPDVRGEVYIGTVTRPYWYFHDVPDHPYECSHRVGVRWDCETTGSARKYQAESLGLGIRGGFWARGFQVLERVRSFPRLEERIAARRSKLDN